MTEADREAAFEALVVRVRGCVACPRMEGRTRVLSRANGPVAARVLFVAEAPGRLVVDEYRPASPSLSHWTLFPDLLPRLAVEGPWMELRYPGGPIWPRHAGSTPTGANTR